MSHPLGNRRKFSRAEIVAYFCLRDEHWNRTKLQNAIASCDPRKRLRATQQQERVQLVADLLQFAPARPKRKSLITFLESHRPFQIWINRKPIRRWLDQLDLDQRSLAWLDWSLPRLNHQSELAGMLGLTARGLAWLTSPGASKFDCNKHYISRWVKKRSTGFRLIEAPKHMLKSAQRIILQDLLHKVPVHESAQGYRIGKSIVDFARPHAGKAYCLRMDLKDFFPSIQGSRVYGFFRFLGYCRAVAWCLTALTTVRTPEHVLSENPRWQRKPKENRLRRGANEWSRLYLPSHLPQGAPTSPALANLLAYQLDARLSGLARAAGVSYTRYADDLLFSGGVDLGRQAKSFATTVGAIALEEGFEINFRKTKRLAQSQRQQVAGMIINQKVNASRRDFDQLKAILFNCCRDGPASQNRDQHPHFRSHLRGRIEWIKMLNPTWGKKLLRLFDKIAW